MNKKLALWSIGCLLACCWQAQASSVLVDSIGIEKKDGKRFILHRVEEGQTLYSIARRYNTSVEFIQQANQALGNAVHYNQVIRVPTTAELSKKEAKAQEKAARQETKATNPASSATRPTVTEIDANGLYKPNTKAEAKAAKLQADADTKAAQNIETDLKKNPGIHLVETGQTLYSLSVRYNVLLADLRKWNKLTSDNLQPGQELIVSEKTFLARQPSNPPVPVTPSPKIEASKSEWTKVDAKKNEPPKIEPSRPETAKADPPRPVVTKPESAHERNPSEDRPAKSSEPVESSPGTLPAKGRRISEIGMADLINSNDPSSKLLALHRSAPVGSLVQVRNDINNASLWVKVIGKLPDTGVNDRILIKLSAKAFEKLSPNQQRFRAEVTYMVP